MPWRLSTRTTHSVAFHKIAKGLSQEQGKVFRFQEQERLHEELIDDGIAKIYLSHLKVAADLADKYDRTLVTKLLEGKPHHAIRSYLAEVKASLVMVGMTGIHADGGLDIGSCAENLLRWTPCHVWLGQTEFEPDADMVAAETIMWSDEAEARSPVPRIRPWHGPQGGAPPCPGTRPHLHHFEHGQ